MISDNLTIGIVVYDETLQIQKLLRQLKTEINHHIQSLNVNWIFVLNHPDLNIRNCIFSEIKEIIPTFKFYENIENNLGLARNIILTNSETDLVYLTDPDIEHTPQTLTKLLNLAQMSSANQKLVGFTGPVIHRSNSKLMNDMFYTLQNISKKIPFSFQIQNHTHLTTVDHAPTCHLLLIKKSALEISGFSEQITHVGEDLDFSHRAYAADLRFLFSPEASVTHHQNMSLLKWLSKVLKFGRAQIMVHKKNSHLPLRAYRLMPLSFIFLFVFLAFLSKYFLFLAMLIFGLEPVVPPVPL